MHRRLCMIVKPQLYYHEIMYSAHEETGHHGVGKVIAWVQERHTWPDIKRDSRSHQALLDLPSSHDTSR